MKVEILRSVMISGEPADAGSILEVEDSDAATLIGLGKAVEYKQEDAPAVEDAPACPPKKPTTRKRTKES